MADVLKTEIADITEKIELQLDRAKIEVNNEKPAQTHPGSLFWFIHVFALFVNLINTVIGLFNVRIKALEEDNDSSESSETPDQATHNTQRHSAHPSTLRRCAKCHARGHAENNCTTADPAAMRRRVAANQRRKKDARQMHTNLAFPPPLPYHYQQNPFVPPQPQVNFAALAADASELRRRQTQSARDKRRVRNSS